MRCDVMIWYVHLSGIGCDRHEIPAPLYAILSEQFEGRVIRQSSLLSHHCEQTSIHYLGGRM